MSTHTTTLLDSDPPVIILPDLINDCPYPRRLNPHCDSVSRASEQWFLEVVRLAEPTLTRFMGLRAGVYAAGCYPDADAFHLIRVCSDFMYWAFKYDDWTDEFDVNGVRGMHEDCMSVFRGPVNFQTETLSGMLCKSYFSRFKQTAGPGCTERFVHTLNLFFIAVEKEADDRTKGYIPDLETYIATRRDTVGSKYCFALIEYAAQIDLPDMVVSHPVIMGMEEAATDYSAHVNDISSYNVEQSRGDTHNIIVVLMREQGLDLQAAVDYIGQLCNSCIQRFEDNRAILPSWGEEVDRQVAIYVQGLQDWIVTNLHWSFDTTRYFGEGGHAVKQDRIVKLLPKMSL